MKLENLFTNHHQEVKSDMWLHVICVHVLWLEIFMFETRSQFLGCKVYFSSPVMEFILCDKMKWKFNTKLPERRTLIEISL